jgi:hypothetical protein
VHAQKARGVTISLATASRNARPAASAAPERELDKDQGHSHLTFY